MLLKSPESVEELINMINDEYFSKKKLISSLNEIPIIKKEYLLKKLFKNVVMYFRDLHGEKLGISSFSQMMTIYNDKKKEKKVKVVKQGSLFKKTKH